jgi:hypothetical protein
MQYLVLPDPEDPWLLARVRWPDVYQAISAAEPDWRTDPGLFDLPYDPVSVAVTAERAEAIAAQWGARLPAPDEGSVPGPTLIRRMPANWSDLSPAARRAWWIEPRRSRASAPPRESRRARRWRRREDAPAALDADAVIVLNVDPADVIDLTDGAQAQTVTTGEDA